MWKLYTEFWTHSAEVARLPQGVAEAQVQKLDWWVCGKPAAHRHCQITCQPYQPHGGSLLTQHSQSNKCGGTNCRMCNWQCRYYLEWVLCHCVCVCVSVCVCVCVCVCVLVFIPFSHSLFLFGGVRGGVGGRQECRHKHKWNMIKKKNPEKICTILWDGNVLWVSLRLTQHISRFLSQVCNPGQYLFLKNSSIVTVVVTWLHCINNSGHKCR